jgi:DNA-binding transcriptional ArsR family regulator
MKRKGTAKRTGGGREDRRARLEVVRDVLRSPVRVRIVGACLHGQEHTQSELARALSLSNPTVYHHIKVLRGAGILRQTGTRPGPKGITEKLYTADVENWQTLSANPNREVRFDFMLDFVLAWMSEIQRDGSQCIKKDYDNPFVVGSQGCHASGKDILRLKRKLQKAVEEFCDSHRTKKKGTRSFAATFAVTPVSTNGLMTQKRIFEYEPQRKAK